MSRNNLGLVTTVILQNTDKLYMKQGSYESAAMAADELMGATFNAHSVKQIEEQHIQQGDKFFVMQRMSYYTPQEQKALWVKWLMELGVGEAFAKIGADVRFIRVIPNDSTTTDEEIEEWRKQQPWLTTVNVTKASFKWSIPPQSSQDTSSNSDSSPQSRRRIDDLFESEEENEDEDSE